MSKPFRLGDYLKPEETAVPKLNTERIEYLPLDLIDPDPDNFYSLEGIADLAENIELVGLLDPIRVRPALSVGSADSSPSRGAKGRYIVVSGHRRRAACMMIRDGGSHMFDGGVACIVERGGTDDWNRLRLIFANSHTRVLSPAEISRQADEVLKLLTKLKASGMELPGRMREHVAEALNVSSSKLGRVQAIRRNLVPELLAMYDAGRINEAVAYRISQEDAEMQGKILAEQGEVLQHLTADGIAAYVAHRRFMDSHQHDDGAHAAETEGNTASSPFGHLPPVKGATPSEGKADDGDDGPPERRDAEKKTPARSCRLKNVLPWEAEMWRRVKARREALGLSIQDVYETDPDYNYVIEGYENGEPCEWDPITELSLTDDERNDFADLLQCSLDYLYSRSDIPETAEQLLNNLPQPVKAKLCETEPAFASGTPPRDGRYFVRIDMGDGGTHEAVGSWRGGSWSVFNGPLYETMKVTGWYPLPEKGGGEK